MYIKASKNRARTRKVYADEEVQVENGAVEVDPEATELVFETADVAELIAEVTGEDVEVVADEDEVTFTVGEMDYTVTAEGGEETLEASTGTRGRAVRANSRPAARKNVAASTNNRIGNKNTNGRVVRRTKK